ncbi:hypothetical protein ACFU3J_08200 [Streptomyces sp. NPDC057411]|uniref:hypothetical protein n=1 Tax=unclassified Streptomyces TaxID=2593676 RepID=UPI00363820C2
MARFFNVRGFLDCDYDDLPSIREIIDGYRTEGHRFHLSDSAVALYLDGWLFQKREINWIAHAFFGASMKAGGVDLVYDQLENIARLIPEVSGVFFVDDEENGPTLRWDVAQSEVVKRHTPVSPSDHP